MNHRPDLPSLSSSSSADRRLSALARHLEGSLSAMESAVSASPTSATSNGNSVFAHLVRAPEDPILGVTVAFNKDPSPLKLNLGVGAYRTEEGKPLVLNVVRQAEQLLVNNRNISQLLAAIQENRVTTVQCLSGTGSLRVGAEFLARHYDQRVINIPQPTWQNHPKVFTLAGLSVKTYRYYDPATRGLNFQGGNSPPPIK